jgi:dienelactone hydrolase
LKNLSSVLVILMVLTGGILSFFLCWHSSLRYEMQPVSFVNSDGHVVNACLYLPGSKHGKFPTLVSIHYGLQNREALHPMSSTLAENDIIVLEILLKGVKKDGSRKNFVDYLVDINECISFLEKHEEVDPDRIFLSGHSIGGNIASIVGLYSDRIAGVAAIGYPVEFPKDSRVNFLLATGVFDQLHEPAKMMRAFESSIDSENESCRMVTFSPRQVGNFRTDCTEGSRIYFQSFLSDHYVEPTDPDITAAVMHFVKTTGQHENPKFVSCKSVPYIFKIKVISRIIFYTGLVFLFVKLFIFFKTGKYFAKKILEILHERTTSIIFLLVYFFVGTNYKPGENILSVYMVSALLTAVILFNFFNLKLKQRDMGMIFDPGKLLHCLGRDIKKVLVTGGIIYSSFAAGLYFHAGISAYSSIEKALRTITGIFYVITGHLFILVTRINGFFLNSDWTFNWISPVVWLVAAAELIYPGGIGRIFDEVLSLIIKQIQELDFSIKWKFNWSGFILLVVLTIAGIMVWRQILAEGYMIGISEIMGLIYLFFCFIILPAVVFILSIRWEPVRKLMARLSFQGESDK